MDLVESLVVFVKVLEELDFENNSVFEIGDFGWNCLLEIEELDWYWVYEIENFVIGNNFVSVYIRFEDNQFFYRTNTFFRTACGFLGTFWNGMGFGSFWIQNYLTEPCNCDSACFVPDLNFAYLSPNTF